MMVDIKEINIGSLDRLASYFVENRKNVQQVIIDLGEVREDNGYGSVFLKPFNPLFKMIWVHQEENSLKSVGLGGPEIKVSFRDLCEAYEVVNHGFIPYDSNHVYAFQKKGNQQYTILVYSSDKLMDGIKILQDPEFNQMDIAINL